MRCSHCGKIGGSESSPTVPQIRRPSPAMGVIAREVERTRLQVLQPAGSSDAERELLEPPIPSSLTPRAPEPVPGLSRSSILMAPDELAGRLAALCSCTVHPRLMSRVHGYRTC